MAAISARQACVTCRCKLRAQNTAMPLPCKATVKIRAERDTTENGVKAFERDCWPGRNITLADTPADRDRATLAAIEASRALHITITSDRQVWSSVTMALIGRWSDATRASGVSCARTAETTPLRFDMMRSSARTGSLAGKLGTAAGCGPKMD